MSELRVTAVNLRQMLATLSDGTCVPVTEMFDQHSELTVSPDDCVVFICGRGNTWFAKFTDSFEKVRAQ